MTDNPPEPTEVKITLDAIDALHRSWLERFSQEEMAEGARFIEERFGA